MIRRIRNQMSLVLAAILATTISVYADETGLKAVAEKPYLTIFAASIDRLRSAYESIFDSVDRPELADSLNDRLKG